MKKRTFKHLSWNDRLTIEKMLLAGHKPPEIAKVIQCTVATIYNELRRAQYVHTNSDLTTEIRYAPEQAQKRYEETLRNKGPDLKIGTDLALADYLEDKILNKKYSPAAALYAIKNENLSFSVEIKSPHTIYSYIRKGVFLGLCMEEYPVRPKKRKHQKKRVKRVKGTSIEKRPKEVDSRDSFGHWEMDTVIGQATNKKSLLVFTERKTRFEIVEVLKEHTTEQVIKALNRVEKKFKSDFFKVFQTITVDNGTEFSNCEGMEKALHRVGKRTKVYYCHAYSSCERGSNENQNKLIRRFYPKGSNFDEILDKERVKEIQRWINKYPRRLFDGKTAEMRFFEEYEKLKGG